jgi:hypothetical protein
MADCSPTYPDRFTTVVRRRSSIQAEHLPDGSWLLFDPEREMTCAISSTGGLLWETLADPWTIEALAELLHSRFDAEREVIDADVHDFVQHMQSLGLLERAIGK